jgi:hypothetical protein
VAVGPLEAKCWTCEGMDSSLKGEAQVIVSKLVAETVQLESFTDDRELTWVISTGAFFFFLGQK